MAKLKIKTGGGGEGEQPKAASLSYPQINLWSDFVDSNPNVKGMDAMWEAFSKAHPKHGIDREVLTSDLNRVMKVVQDRASAWGEESPGSLTTGMAFPKVQFENTPYGRMNSYGLTEVPMPQPKVTYPAKLIQREVPKDVKDFWWDDKKGLWGYDDPQEGVIKYAQKSAVNNTQMKDLAAKVYLSQKKSTP
jgi:hypothetical protein